MEGYRFQIVFLDIDLEEERDGIDYAEEMFRIDPSMKVIYVTGYNDRYSQLIFLKKSNLAGYLTKPVSQELLVKYLQKTEEDIKREEDEKLVICSGRKIINILYSEIYFIESQGHKVIIHTENKEYTVYKKLKEIMAGLGESFVQSPKSFAVNMDMIKRIESKTIILKDDTEVVISKAYLSAVKERYFSYMSRLI